MWVFFLLQNEHLIRNFLFITFSFMLSKLYLFNLQVVPFLFFLVKEEIKSRLREISLTLVSKASAEILIYI